MLQVPGQKRVALDKSLKLIETERIEKGLMPALA